MNWWRKLCLERPSAVMKQETSGDSYVNRVDVVRAELLTEETPLEQIKSYLLLRGSRLSPDDKKRVQVINLITNQFQ